MMNNDKNIILKHNEAKVLLYFNNLYKVFKEIHS